MPIYNQQKEIVGVLGGSYDLGNLKKIIFKDIYDGKGSALIASKDGRLITFDKVIKNKKFKGKKSFLVILKKMVFYQQINFKN